MQAFEEASFDFVLLDAPCSALGLRPRLQQTSNDEKSRNGGSLPAENAADGSGAVEAERIPGLLDMHNKPRCNLAPEF